MTTRLTSQFSAAVIDKLISIRPRKDRAAGSTRAALSFFGGPAATFAPALRFQANQDLAPERARSDRITKAENFALVRQI